MEEKNSQRQKKIKKKVKIAGVICVAAVFLLLTAGEYIKPLHLPGWRDVYEMTGLTGYTGDGKALAVHYIDVGQSDSAYISADGCNVLIDGGLEESGPSIIAYLKNCGVQKIDLLVATHPHADHIGGLEAVIDSFEIGEIVMPEIPDKLVPTTKSYTDLLRSIDRKDKKINKAKPGDVYTEGKANFTILGPVGNYSDLNDYSVVMRLDYGHVSFLFTGDSSSPSEKDMLKAGENVDVDVLTVAHHGSNSASTAEYLKAVSPRYAVISVGKGNSYGFPTKAALKRLTDAGATVYRTDLSGTIVFTSDGENLEVHTQKNVA